VPTVIIEEAMDPLSHLALTRFVVGPGRAPLVGALAPDLPFYSCYPASVARRGLLAAALRSGAWPNPPVWLLTLHRAGHCVFPGVLLLVASRLFPHAALRQAGVSWLLHILVDLLSHRRDPWGPRPLWPLSDLAFDGVGWADALVAWIARTVRSTGE
jgi:hypothetical protein